MEKEFTLKMKVNGMAVSEVEATAELSLDHAGNVSIDAIYLDVIGTRGKLRVKTDGEMFAALADQIESDHKNMLADALDDLKWGAVERDREVARDNRRTA